MNFAPIMAAASTKTIAEVREISDNPLPVKEIQLPCVYVDHVISVGDKT